MNKLAKIFLVIVLLSFTVFVLAGCGSPTKTPTTTLPTTSTQTTTSAIPEPDYAGTITDATLKGLSDDNLAEYTKYGDAQFKAAVTQQVLDQVSTQIKNQLGDYESKTYLSTDNQGGYVIAHYRAKYSKGEVGVRMVFDSDHLVAGQFFE